MDNSKVKEIIDASPLFNGLPPEQVERIIQIIVVKRFNRGETIFFEGDKGAGFYIVETGKVKIYKMSLSGKEQILHIFGPGEPIGEVPIFHGQPFPATAEAIVQSNLLFLPRDRFIQLVHETPSIALNMLAVLSMRLRRFATQIENLSLKEVPARLADYLLYLMEEQQNDKKVELEISKGQLASLLGTIPETLSRIFAKMSEEALIEVDGRTIRILDKQGLIDR
jgi:CRP/FNR family transcriptional regulator